MENLSAEQKAAIAEQRAAALEAVSAEFKKADADGSGSLDRNEIKAIVEKEQGKLGAQATEDKINEFFREFDANGDGQVSEAEFLEFFGKMFDELIATGLSIM